MPVKLADLKVPDECILNQEDVIAAASSYLLEKGWSVERSALATEPDIVAAKDAWSIVLKAKGSKSRKQKKGIVFDNSQLRTHVSDQIEKIMRFQQSAEAPTIFIMANPDVYRMKAIVNQLSHSLDKLDIIRMWVQPKREPQLDIPQHLYAIAKQLGF
ncbi:hypothetical protein [Bacillus xiapuensis]|uniref:hypothetical protein n=1 Tax=Bacillus xiapuensis TaxID=2014075 RepID=UPI000C237B4E|nr:hypothetical protein [Bacillus xiapuensis]